MFQDTFLSTLMRNDERCSKHINAIQVKQEDVIIIDVFQKRNTDNGISIFRFCISLFNKRLLKYKQVKNKT